LIDANSLIGKKLGDYRIESKLASGGMAHVFIGIDEKLGRKAAVKVLTPDFSSADDTMTLRFEREARAVAQLEHDNIIPIYQFGDYEGMYFLAMRFIDGGDLSDEMATLARQKAKIEPERLVFILTQVASALDYAHERGIVHRDVKPSNIMLSSNDKAFLTDFGLVLWESVDKTMGTAFGTPRYISPEQATDSQTAVPQSDVYSLAVIIYELLTGHMLYTGNTPMEMAIAHITETPTPPTQYNADIPYEVEAEILRALSKSPEDRHPTATSFIQAIKEAYETAKDAPKTLPMVVTQKKPEDPEPEYLTKNLEHPRVQPRTQVLPQEKQVPAAQPPEPTSRSPLVLIVLVVILLLAAGGGFVLLSGGVNTDDAEPTAVAAVDITEEATAAVIPELTDEPTDAPTDEPTDAPTDEPTDAPTDEPTDEPTDAPTDEPTDTPTDEPTDAPATALTVGSSTGNGGGAITLLYNDRALVLQNNGGLPVDIGGIGFVGGTDDPDDSFRTGALGTTLAAGQCVAIVSTATGSVSIPAEWACDPVRETSIATQVLFWRAESAADEQFRVQDGEREIITCDTVGRAVRRVEDQSCTFDW